MSRQSVAPRLLADVFGLIQQARARLAPVLPPTPLIRSDFLSRRLGRDVFLKLESLQPTGSFKVRPAFNGMLANLEQARSAGVVTSSSGNFAQAVAYAATESGVDAQIVMMRGASKFKRDRTRGFGGTVVDCEDTFASRWETTFRIQEESGRLLLHPYDSPETIAGDGTLGLELLEQLEGDFDAYVPISGGGLISGVATAVKQVRPGCRVIGVQAKANPSMHDSIKGETAVTTRPEPSLADALAVATPGERTLEIVRRLVDDIELVSEKRITEAVKLLANEQKLVAEGGGAVGVAALARGGRPAVCVLSGGNILPEKLRSVLAAAALA